MASEVNLVTFEFLAFFDVIMCQNRSGVHAVSSFLYKSERIRRSFEYIYSTAVSGFWLNVNIWFENLTSKTVFHKNALERLNRHFDPYPIKKISRKIKESASHHVNRAGRHI